MISDKTYQAELYKRRIFNNLFSAKEFTNEYKAEAESAIFHIYSAFENEHPEIIWLNSLSEVNIANYLLKVYYGDKYCAGDAKYLSASAFLRHRYGETKVEFNNEVDFYYDTYDKLSILSDYRTRLIKIDDFGIFSLLAAKFGILLRDELSEVDKSINKSIKKRKNYLSCQSFERYFLISYNGIGNIIINHEIYSFFSSLYAAHILNGYEISDKEKKAAESLGKCPIFFGNGRYVLAIKPFKMVKCNEDGLPHSLNGPALIQYDGTEISAWRGQYIPNEFSEGNFPNIDRIIRDSSGYTTRENEIALEMIGWQRVLEESKSITKQIIDVDDNPEIGTLIKVVFPSTTPFFSDLVIEKFLSVQCGTGRQFALRVTSFPYDTAKECNAATYGWKPGQPIENYLPTQRT